jgi:hypothetical protein
VKLDPALLAKIDDVLAGQIETDPRKNASPEARP